MLERDSEKQDDAKKITVKSFLFLVQKKRNR